MSSEWDSTVWSKYTHISRWHLPSKTVHFSHRPALPMQSDTWSVLRHCSGFPCKGMHICLCLCYFSHANPSSRSVLQSPKCRKLSLTNPSIGFTPYFCHSGSLWMIFFQLNEFGTTDMLHPLFIAARSWKIFWNVPEIHRFPLTASKFEEHRWYLIIFSRHKKLICFILCSKTWYLERKPRPHR